jgi:hypothetical protein
MMIMGNGQMLATQFEYEGPLLRLLCELPAGQGKVNEICELFEQKYRRVIPQEHYSLTKTGEPIWRNNVRWCRDYSNKRGFLEPSRRGTWRISEAGRRWVEENPTAMRVGPLPGRGSQKSRRKSAPKASPTPGITLEMLKTTRDLMPNDQFRSVWGEIYDRLQAEERARAITAVTQTELGRRARRRLDEIHDFLRGKSSSTPSSDMLCDWIHLCYALELHREAAALLPYVRDAEVNSAIYKRAKRVADLCRSKLGS